VEGLIEGRIVHYVAYNGRHLAAMIIGVNPEETTADLVVFTNMPNVNGIKNFGMQFHQNVELGLKPGTWHWIERDETTRSVPPIKPDPRLEKKVTFV
jgi:hypothetical protein